MQSSPHPDQTGLACGLGIRMLASGLCLERHRVGNAVSAGLLGCSVSFSFLVTQDAMKELFPIMS